MWESWNRGFIEEISMLSITKVLLHWCLVLSSETMTLGSEIKGGRNKQDGWEMPQKNNNGGVKKQGV